MRWWPWNALAAAGLALSGCDGPPPPAPETELDQTEQWSFDSAEIRRTVDEFKSSPTRLHRRQVEKAFADFDRKLIEMQQRAANETGDDRAVTETRIAALLRCREIHRSRCMATPEAVTVRSAQRIVVRRAQAVNRW